MHTKENIVKNWLPRYTGRALEEFDNYILLTNFNGYVNIFADKYGVDIVGKDKAMPNASANGITIINFTMGSANAATIMDLLSAVQPKACLFLGKCGGLKRKTEIGDLILPIAAIRGEGTSNDYFPAEVPALPAFTYKEPYQHPLESMEWIIGQVLFTQQTVEFGNMMMTLKIIYEQLEQWQSTWKLLLCLLLVLLTKFQWEHYY